MGKSEMATHWPIRIWPDYRRVSARNNGLPEQRTPGIEQSFLCVPVNYRLFNPG
jgi:hypothetical protein